MSALRHILADPVEESPRPTRPSSPPTSNNATPKAAAATPMAQLDGSADAKAKGDESREDGETPVYTSTTQTTRRNANGSVSSVYSGNKIRHLKKEDGIPLWRKDIQYEFLRLVFDNEEKCFTRYSDAKEGFTFAEIYVDAMSKSSKCSKILKEKLAQDVPSAIIMAMVCLLVNVGRMNTTLNFFPEMRAQLRTYHSIPALQAKQDPNAYKQLQDAPRLKSILKGATEDSPQPGTIEDIKAAKKPRTNPVNLIFVLAQYAPKISEMHFTAPRDFFDLVMRSTLSSKSRANAFLWLMWHYLESDFSLEGVQKNPFGRGHEGPGTGGMPIKVPELEGLTEEEADKENVDTPSEEEFGNIKRKERIAIVASEPSPAMTALKRARKERSMFGTGEGSEGVNTPSRDFHSPVPHGSAYSHDGRPGDYGASDNEQTRSPSPPASGFQAINKSNRSSGMNIKNMLSEDDPAMNPPPAAMPKKGPGRGNWRRNKEPQPILPNTPSYGFIHESPAPNTPAPHVLHASPPGSTTFHVMNTKDHIPTPSYQSTKRNRPLTSHQQAVSDHRRTRIGSILDLGLRKRLRMAKQQREDEGAIAQSWKRLRMLPSGWDSDDESTDKAKDDSKDKEKDDATKNKTKDDDRVAAALKKAAANTPILGGFRVPKTERDIEREKSRPINEPDPDDDDDFGEQALYLNETLCRFNDHMDLWNMREGGAVPLMELPEPTQPFMLEWEKEEEEHVQSELAVTQTPRPRQIRRRGGASGPSRKPKGGASTPATAATTGENKDPAASLTHDDDETMLDGEDAVGQSGHAGDAGELDDDDRELLGEADGDESDDEEDPEDMDED